MPLYNYRCLACEDTFEILQTISESPLKFCGDYCTLPKYVGSNHLYTPLREQRGQGVVKKWLSSSVIRFTNYEKGV